MAENRQAMGNDPLAWLAEEPEAEVAEIKPVTKRGRKKTSKPAVSAQEATTKTDIDLVEESFSLLAAQGQQVVSDFYEYLFTHYPELAPLFDGVSSAGQQKKLLAALLLLVRNLRNPDVLHDYLQSLGTRHQSYGVAAEDYQKVADSLIAVLKKRAGSHWTDAVASAWSNTLSAVAQLMLSGYDSAEEPEMAVTSVKQEEDFTSVMAKALDSAVTAVMMIDRDFTITYANQSTLDMLAEHEDTLRQIFPGFSVKGLVGSNIDTFHKHPQHQRQLLSDPSNLPFTTDITVGPLAFRLNVTAMRDEHGAYVGNMLEWHNVTEEKLRNADIHGQFDALNKVMGVISFNMDGTIIDINDNFLKVVGYEREEVVGKHHRMFAEPELANSPAYTEFWAKLNRGEFDSGEYKRVGKGGREIWLQASYNPIFDINGKPFKVVKFATEITDAKLQQLNFEGQIDAINKAMGVISFNMDGTIIDMNDNFLSVVGYSRDEVVGKHHRMFAEPELANSAEYTEFWAKLNRGEFDSGEYRRVGKGNKEIWLQASYNPIFDMNGKPYKVVKFAADITPEKQLQMTVESVLQSTSVVMNAMADGDLTKQMEGVYEGEFAQLQQAINDTVSKMSSVVSDITEAAISISSAATEISQGNVDLSQRTEEQASSLEETASSMEQLTSTVRQNSDNARQANQLAVDAREKAEKGGAVIQNAIEAMAAISASSKKVADIIGVIDEIAFQTNLLALNAAVEAARAGEQGRGFAVVASEVRNLAQRSAAAAKEIKELINDSGEKVREGSELVDESGRTLEDIVDGAKKVGDIISEIAAAGVEQTAGIEQVNKAVTQMDEMTQQNAALVEEAAAAGESLEEQGKSLQQMMDFFNTGQEIAAAPRQEPRLMSRKPKPAAAQPARKPVSRQAPKVADDDEWEEF
jgi:methyl-accepting chemotaxis protein